MVYILRLIHLQLGEWCILVVDGRVVKWDGSVNTIKYIKTCNTHVHDVQAVDLHVLITPFAIPYQHVPHRNTTTVVMSYLEQDLINVFGAH